MATTADQWQQWILQQVGAGLEGTDELDILTPTIGAIWDAWADKALVAPRLQYWYALRHAADILIGQLRNQTWSQLGPMSVQGGQKLKNLQMIRDNAQAEIGLVEKRAAGYRPPVVGALRQTAPILPAANQPDPNSRAYRGDALVAPADLNPPPTTSGSGDPTQ